MQGDLAVVGDIGGTNFRLGLSTPGGLMNVREFKYAADDTPESLITAYLSACDAPEKITSGVFAVASPSSDPAGIIFTNGPWKQKPVSFEIEGMENSTINDFAALTYSVCQLQESDCTIIRENNSRPFFPAAFLSGIDQSARPSRAIQAKPSERFVVIGPGTGLGVGSGAMTKHGQFIVMDGEGGHIGFSPATEEELDIKHYLETEHGLVVSVETIASGTGLPRLFNAFGHVRKVDAHAESARDVSDIALQGEGPAKECADATLELFAKTLGHAASAAVLNANARTLFMAGGVIEKLGPLFRKEAFCEAFTKNDLGPTNFTMNIPVLLLRHPQPGLLGAHAYVRLSNDL